MQTLENPLGLLRQLKGSPLSILMALQIVKQPVSQSWLAAVTGYTDDTIKIGLMALVELGYAVRISGQSWQVTNFPQLPLLINGDNTNVETTENSEVLKSEIEKKRLTEYARQKEYKKKYERSPLGKSQKARANHRRKERIIKSICDLTMKEWEDIKERQGYLCAICGNRRALTRDHIIPVSKGGALTKSNIQGLCRSCNSKKNNKIQLENPKNTGICIEKATSTDIYILNKNKLLVEEVAKNKSEKTGLLNLAIYELLKHAGVGEPVRSELSKNPNLTEKYVKSHIEKMRKERQSPAILIHRLRCEDEIIEADDPEDYRRYLK